MVVNIILIVTLVIVVGTLIYGIINRNKSLDTLNISIKESLDLAGFPIITFYQDDLKFNFLLDTGSNLSYIHSELVDTSVLNDDHTFTTSGFEGIATRGKMCSMEFYYKDILFEEDFGIMDLTEAINTVKNISGVTIHGFLGSDFFRKYKYIIDFDELVVRYTK